MGQTIRDLDSVVGELKGIYGQILEPGNNGSLTSLQQRAAQDQLIKNLKARGIEYYFHYDDDLDGRKYSHVHFNYLTPRGVEGSGTVTDVAAKGHYPIHISVAHDLFVFLEPRDLRLVAPVSVTLPNQTEGAPGPSPLGTGAEGLAGCPILSRPR